MNIMFSCTSLCLIYLYFLFAAQAVPLVKTLNFKIMSSLIFEIAQSANRDVLGELYQQPVKSVLSVPINFPFTCFNHSLQAREKTRTIILYLKHEKRLLWSIKSPFLSQISSPSCLVS